LCFAFGAEGGEHGVVSDDLPVAACVTADVNVVAHCFQSATRPHREIALGLATNVVGRTAALLRVPVWCPQMVIQFHLTQSEKLVRGAPSELQSRVGRLT
jgi:hypothetical protein